MARRSKKFLSSLIALGFVFIIFDHFFLDGLVITATDVGDCTRNSVMFALRNSSLFPVNYQNGQSAMEVFQEIDGTGSSIVLPIFPESPTQVGFDVVSIGPFYVSEFRRSYAYPGIRREEIDYSGKKYVGILTYSKLFFTRTAISSPFKLPECN